MYEMLLQAAGTFFFFCFRRTSCCRFDLWLRVSHACTDLSAAGMRIFGIRSQLLTTFILYLIERHKIN